MNTTYKGLSSSISFSSHNCHMTHFRQIVIKMWRICDRPQKNIYHKFMTFIQLSRKKHLVNFTAKSWNFVQISSLTLGHKFIKVWWKCDELKLVFIFWPMSFESSRRQKTWCQMPDVDACVASAIDDPMTLSHPNFQS